MTRSRWLDACPSFGAVCPAERFATVSAAPYQLRSRPEGLYFLAGGQIQLWNSAGSPTAVRTREGLIYFDFDSDDMLVHATLDPPGLFRGPLTPEATDTEVAVPSEGLFYGFVLTDDAIWQGTSVDTVRVPRDGSSPTAVPATPCIDLVADDRWVFCRTSASSGSGFGRIDRVSLQGETTEVLASAVGDVEVTPVYAYLAPDSEYDPSATATLYRITKDPVVLTPMAFGPVANTFATDAGGLYFTAYESTDGVSVYYLADDASEPVPIAQGMGSSPFDGSTGIDDSYVYFSRFDEASSSGEIFRAPRCGCP